MLPAHAAFLDGWLTAHPRPFLTPDFVPLLRQLGVRYILLHVSGGAARDALREARTNAEINEIGCFDPPAEIGPWPYPICILEVQASKTPGLNVILRNGWSGAEEWGRWIEGTEAGASWAASARSDHRLSLEVFPVCIPGRGQGLVVEVNGQEVASHRWEGCEPWQSEVTIPEQLVRIGWNEVALRPAYAARPIDFTEGRNADVRPLSVGVSRLAVEPAASR
jgi:hypothetical protein